MTIKFIRILYLLDIIKNGDEMKNNKDEIKKIHSGDEVVDFISDYTYKTIYKFKPKQDGVYKVEYPGNVIDTISVYQTSRIIKDYKKLEKKVKIKENKKIFDLYHFKKGRIYYFDVVMNDDISHGTYTLKLTDYEVPLNNSRRNARKVDINDEICGKVKYVTTKDWYTFTSKEDANYKVNYSKSIDSSFSIFEANQKDSICSNVNKIYLKNDIVSTDVELKKNKKYYIKVEHEDARIFEEYNIKFVKKNFYN